MQLYEISKNQLLVLTYKTKYNVLSKYRRSWTRTQPTRGHHSREHPTLAIFHWLSGLVKLLQDGDTSGPQPWRSWIFRVCLCPAAFQNTVVVVAVSLQIMLNYVKTMLNASAIRNRFCIHCVLASRKIIVYAKTTYTDDVSGVFIECLIVCCLTLYSATFHLYDCSL